MRDCVCMCVWGGVGACVVFITCSGGCVWMCICVAFDAENSILGPLSTYIHMSRQLVIHRILLSFVFYLLSCLSVCLSVYHPRGVGPIKDVELIFWKAMGGHRAEPHTHTRPHDMHRLSLSLSLLLKKISQW